MPRLPKKPTTPTPLQHVFDLLARFDISPSPSSLKKVERVLLGENTTSVVVTPTKFYLLGTGTVDVRGVIGGQYSVFALTAVRIMRQTRFITQAQFTAFWDWWQEQTQAHRDTQDTKQINFLAAKLGYTLVKK